MADRPNFFELLDLDPQRTGWPEIEERIKEKKGRLGQREHHGQPEKAAGGEAQSGPAAGDPQGAPGSGVAEAGGRGCPAPPRRRPAGSGEEARGMDRVCSRARAPARPSSFGKICSQFEGIFSEQEIRARFERRGDSRRNRTHGSEASPRAHGSGHRQGHPAESRAVGPGEPVRFPRPAAETPRPKSSAPAPKRF